MKVVEKGSNDVAPEEVVLGWYVKVVEKGSDDVSYVEVSQG